MRILCLFIVELFSETVAPVLPNMPPPPNTKPENVLKRAQELIGVGQSQAALSLLHEHVTSKRTRNNPISSIEPVCNALLLVLLVNQAANPERRSCYFLSNFVSIFAREKRRRMVYILTKIQHRYFPSKRACISKVPI